jgi:hypothetical protein
MLKEMLEKKLKCMKEEKDEKKEKEEDGVDIKIIVKGIKDKYKV